MFADIHHPHITGFASVHALNKPRDRRHIAILQTHPEQRGIVSRQCRNLFSMFDRRTQRLFNQDCEPTWHDLFQHRVMRKIG